MMGMLWVVLLVALTGVPLGQGLPVRSTPEAYPHDTNGESLVEAWGSGSGLYAAVPALALVLTAVGLLLGCTWCYRHKDCKPNEGADNQLFTASATHLHDGRRSHPPDSGFSEPANNNISEDNNNGPISLREMQNIANNNATAYIVSENEERNRVSRESVVEFEPLPSAIRVVDPLERCADWFGGEDFPRNRLQYLREIGRGWFGRVVEGEIEDNGATSTVAVKILGQNASLEDKARFLDECKLYRDVTHENVLAFIAKCLQEDPWVVMFELCSMDLQQYLVNNRPKMAILNESGIPLQLMCDVASALTYLHSRGYLYRNVSSSNVLVRDATGPNPRAVVGSYAVTPPLHDFAAPEARRHPPVYTTSSEIWSLGTLIWEVCTWAALQPDRQPPPPDLPCPYRNHLYQVMQLCWNPSAEARPSAAQVQALLEHLRSTHATPAGDRGSQGADFEARWQTLKPNSIPKLDEHVALVHAPSTSQASHFTGSEEFDDTQTTKDALSVDMDTAVSRSSSIMSDKDPLSVQIRSESLNNLHGSLEDVRNIYLTHNETAALECHQGNISFEERERELDKSDSSVDPWVKDLIAGSQDDVSYYRDVSDVIKNLDNILNSEKTSSSESSHQASPSRDNLSLDCKKDYPIQSSMVKSPGITNFKNIFEMGLDVDKDETCEDDEVDRDTIGTLSHSFERHSDTTSQHTLENLTPETPIKDFDFVSKDDKIEADIMESTSPLRQEDTELPKENIDNSDSELPKKDLCVVSLSSVSENEQLNIKDCVTSCDNLAEIVRTEVEPKSIDNTVNDQEEIEEKSTLNVLQEDMQMDKQELNSDNKQRRPEIKQEKIKNTEDMILPAHVTEIATNIIENEVFYPAIEIVTKMIEKKELEAQAAEQSEGIPPRLDVRENNENKKITIVAPGYLKMATYTLIEEERKVSEPVQKAVNVPVLTESKIKEILKQDIAETEMAESPTSQEVVEELLPQVEPEPVQINNRKIKSFNSETEKAEPTSIENIPEEELLGFSSNFTDINFEVQATNATKILPPELVQNVNHEVTKKADLSSLVVNDTEHKTFTPSLAPEFSNEAVITALITQDNNVSPIEITSQFAPGDTGVDTNGENEIKEKIFEGLVNVRDGDSQGSDNLAAVQSNDSTVYMDLINYTNSKTNNSEVPEDNVKEFIKSCLEMSSIENSCSIIKNDSTVYLDLPCVLKDTNNFLNSESVVSQENNLCTSTPKGSECSADETLEGSIKPDESNLSETKVTDETAIAKSEQKFISELLSPFDSPTKSHPTDTYDENSSVVLGPFENCAIECKGVKTDIELPKEELLAFSSNFSEINLETPSPLRDGNFLNEVPDIAADDLQFDDGTLSEDKKDKTENTDETDQSATTKHVSPSTPPNSPGVYLASTSHQKYLVDIALDPPETQSYPQIETDSGLSSLQKEIDLNQIELQITTKLAMAENENNMNIEYSGPLTVEGLVSEEDAALRESDATPEAFLAGNGGSIEDRSEGLSLDEECVKALRNELELKLPLAQVAGIEPAVEEWGSLPPPPELILHYGAGGALSPIQEETRHQLKQLENDNWDPSVRTESSESYPEPCNDSTAEVTDLPTAASPDRTYTVHSHHTYTVQKDIPTSRELTMSADSLNGSPFKKPANKPESAMSPIDDKTYNKNDDEKISNCEHISQVSPFLMSPTTDTSAPDSVDNATGVSTLSKTSVPTDAKHSKPSECLSKATSIDSWCSNDTLYNVEENFDDLVMEADIPEFEKVKNELVKSASTETLTDHDDEKDASHCSTYIVHDTKSEPCETFSPDSITANDNHTYTKVKTEVTGTTPSVVTKSDVNESTKSQTKDLAYGTLPSYSSCTTELISGIDDPWKFALPELVRRSPIADEATFTPPRVVEDKESILNDSPLTTDASIKKMDSVELSCLEDEINHKSDSSGSQFVIDVESPHNYKNNMAPSITSTPFSEPPLDDDNVNPMFMKLPTDSGSSENHESLLDSFPNFQVFVQSAEIRPQDTTYNQDTALLLEGDSKTLSRNSNRDSIVVADRTPNYSDFENSAVLKPQEVHSVEKSSQNIESGMSSGDFKQFENSVRVCPQDLSSLMDANSLFLNSERKSSDLAANSIVNPPNDLTSQSRFPDLIQNLDLRPNPANLVESQHVIPNISFSMYVTDLDEEETDQPHSIIFTEVSPAPRSVPKSKEQSEVKDDSNEAKETPDKTFDSHTNINLTFDSHTGKARNSLENDENIMPKVNGTNEVEDIIDNVNQQSPKPEVSETAKSKISAETTMFNDKKDIPNGSITEVSTDLKDIVCNGNSQNYATVNFINESFEELGVNHATDNKSAKEPEKPNEDLVKEFATEIETTQTKKLEVSQDSVAEKKEVVNGVEEEIAATKDFLQNEKDFCAVDVQCEIPTLLNDIRFTGPTSEIMSTSFTQDSPTEPNSPECEQDGKSDAVADIVKEWDSDSESHSSNSSSGEFIWKDGDGHETPVVPNTHFEHQQDGGTQGQGSGDEGGEGAGSAASGDSGSGSEGDEVEFVPSSWDCRAAPAKSSLRTREQQPPNDKKRVVFKRQKYHCVYEYPRELAEVETHSPAYLPDLSTYCEWDPTSAEEAELGYGQLYGTPLDMYQLRSGIAFGSDYDDDFFISSSARPFETLGVMSSGSQFFPGMHLKHSLSERDHPDDVTALPPPPAPLLTALTHTRTPSLDFTTPDSGVEDITPGSTSTDEDFKMKKLDTDVAQTWKPIDSASSSESVSPSSPGGEALGGLRHTRDKLKLDLPPSPHIPSPRHNRVFNFVLDKPKRRVSEETSSEVGTTPLVMTDDTPIITSSLPIPKDEDVTVPEPTFSTFGKCNNPKTNENDNAEQKMILTDEIEESPTTESKEDSVKTETVKGEGTVLDSGDEDSGIESSSKATLERKTNVS